MNKFILPILSIIAGCIGWYIVYAIGNYLMFPEMDDLNSFIVCLLVAWFSTLAILINIRTIVRELANRK